MRNRIAPFTALALTLAACQTTPPQPVDVPPPVIITVVVTAAGSAPAAATASPGKPATQTGLATQPPYPVPFQNTVDAVYQDFERGFMIYLGDRKVIWVFARSVPDVAGTPVATQKFGVWLGFPDKFKDGDPETDPAIVPPANFQQPKRGFGKIWRENAGVRDALGWGLDFERPYSASVTDYSIGVFGAGGAYVPKSFIHIVTTANGAVVHVDEAAQTWARP